MAGIDIANGRASSLTVAPASSWLSRAMMARRVGSESAAKTRSRFKLTIELTNGAVQRPRQARCYISSP